MLKRKSSVLASALVVLLALVCALPIAAQDNQPSKIDVFGGYAYADPGSKGFATGMKAMNKGVTGAATYWNNRYMGFTVDAGATWGDNFNRLWTVQAGPALRFPTEHATVFGHALAGLYDLRVPILGSNGNLGISAGGGLDLNVSKHFDIRVAQGDFQWGRFSTLRAKSEFAGGRFASGLVFKFGTIGPPPAPPSAACSLQPTEVFEGEPVTATATGSNFNPKRTLAYTWSGTGVNVTGSTATVNIDTKGLQPGQYTVKANISDGKKGT